MVPTIEADLARLAGAFAPDESGRYLNFTEEPTDVEDMFPAGAVPRLRAVRASLRPGGTFQSQSRGLRIGRARSTRAARDRVPHAIASSRPRPLRFP